MEGLHVALSTAIFSLLNLLIITVISRQLTQRLDVFRAFREKGYERGNLPPAIYSSISIVLTVSLNVDV